MKRSYVGLLIAAVAMSLAAPVAASGNPIAGAIGNLRWGMSSREVKTALKAKIKDKSSLQELEASFVEFDGRSTRWDSSPIAEEYTHGNEEAMLSYKDRDGSENYYFFIGGQLWKWVKLYPASAFGGHDFARFAGKVRDRFGSGHEKQGQVNPGSGQSYQFIEFLDRNTRLRAVDKTQKQSQYALMFEAMDTVRTLSSLRSNTIRRATAKHSSAVASAPAPARSEPPASSTPRFQKSNGAVASNSGGGNKNKKSIFSDEQQQDDSADDYNAKKQRVQAEAREKQRRAYDRGQEAKKGKILDDLAGMDDDDPISGAR
jgi:hypothetical protein